MKTRKRISVVVGTVTLAGTLLSPSALAAPSAGTASGAYAPGTSAGNGADHGWGNCGYNNGGSTKFEGPEGGNQRGLGGFRKGDSCAVPQPLTDGQEEAADSTDTTGSTDTESGALTEGSTEGSTGTGPATDLLDS